jgi:hypothetical protein
LASSDELQLQVLRLMRDATAAGIITWEVSESNRDWFYTATGPIQTYIQFKWPSYNGDVGSDRDFVEVDAAGRFMIGTPGWSLALEILAAGFEDWRAHVAQLREGYERKIRILAKAIEERPGRHSHAERENE